MTRMLTGFFWITLYLAVVLVPVFLMLAPPTPSGRGFWLEFSIALGFVGLTQIAVQFVLIARFKRVTAPYGIDIILQYHRQIALVAVAAILVHPLIIVIDNPSRLKLLNPMGGNWASRMGWASVLCLAGLVVTSLFRERLRIRYEWWRLGHLLLGVAAIGFAQAHVSLAGLYTNAAWKQVIWIAIAVGMVGLVLYLRVIKPARQSAFRWRVVEVRPQRGDTFTLALEPSGHEGMRFEPGQFAWIKLGNSPFTLEEHPFSFSSSAERTERLEFGIKALGDFTRSIADVPPGTPAYLDGPHGSFSIDRYPAAGFVFIAGGIGITPMMSFLNTMADRADRRPVTLIYGNARCEQVAYREELEQLRDKLDLRTVHVLEEPPEGWEGERGYIDRATLERVLPRDTFARSVFVCGPGVMMQTVLSALSELEIPHEHVHAEKFELV
jgi:predicted ferric reductase